MKISQKGMADLILKYLTTLVPVATNVTLKVEKGKPVKGDAYLPKDISTVIAKSLAKALFEHVVGYIDNPVVTKINELIGEYNQLRTDIITAAIPTTAASVDKIPTT